MQKLILFGTRKQKSQIASFFTFSGQPIPPRLSACNSLSRTFKSQEASQDVPETFPDFPRKAKWTTVRWSVRFKELHTHRCKHRKTVMKPRVMNALMHALPTSRQAVRPSPCHTAPACSTLSTSLAVRS